MKIAFMWKGWSGKTTLTTAFTKYLARKYPEKNILLFDVDINSHILAEFWYNDENIKKLGGKFQEVLEILEPKIQKSGVLSPNFDAGTLPLNKETNIILPQKNHEIYKKFWLRKENIIFFELGNYTDKENPENACYHGLLNAYELLIHRVIDSKKDFVIADTTAGIDNVGTSLFMAYSTTFFVVEPTKRSISVYQEYIKNSEVDESLVYVIGNKIANDDDKHFLEKNIPPEKIIWYISENKKIHRWEISKWYDEIITENAKLFEKMEQISKNTHRNSEIYFEKLYWLFKKEVSWWWNSMWDTKYEEIFPKNHNFYQQLYPNK